jgi:hypothetical protein
MNGKTSDAGPQELQQLRVRFDGLTSAAANQAALELADVLRASVGPDGSVEIAKTDNRTQDMGATLVLLLGTPAAIAIAKGIHDYISKRGSRVVIETPEGSVIATGDAAKNIDIAKTAEAIRKKKVGS